MNDGKIQYSVRVLGFLDYENSEPTVGKICFCIWFSCTSETVPMVTFLEKIEPVVTENYEFEDGDKLKTTTLFGIIGR